MTKKLAAIGVVFFVTTFIGTLESNAQQLNPYCPWPYTIRCCAASPNSDEVYAGDDGYFMIWLNNSWKYYGFLDQAGAPDSSQTYYAACFLDGHDLALGGSSGGRGLILCSKDSGANWSGVLLGVGTTIRGIATDGAGDYFAVGDSGLILESTNAGTSWTKLASPTRKQLNAIQFGPSGKYAVAAGNDSAIVVSTDGGATWNLEAMPYDLSPLGSALKHVDFSAVAISPMEDSVWVGLEQPVLPLLLIHGKADPAQKFTFFPTSGSLTALAYTGDTTANYLLAFAADDYIYGVSPKYGFIHNNIPYASDADGNIDTAAFRIHCAAPELSATGGWNYILGGKDLAIFSLSGNGVYLEHNPGYSYNADYLDADVQNGVGWIVGAYGTIDWTNDGGSSRYIQAIDTVTINSVWQRNGILAIATGWDGTILRTNDGGHNWEFVPSGTQERLHGIAFPTASDGIITGDYGTILRSMDTGNSWTPIASSATTYLRAVAFADDHTGIIAGDSAAIFRTTDTGLTWQPINNFLTGTDVSIRKLQAFPGGLYYAQAGGDLVRSTDNGLNWSVLPSPGDEIAMSFYNSQIGLIGSRVTSSEIVPDTVYMSYTTDGGASWIPFVVPMLTARRLVIYWLNNHQAVLNGNMGYVTEVTISASGVTLTPLSVATSDVRVYPNPTAGNFHVSYSTKTSGPVTIQLFSEDGKDMGTLFSGTEEAGAHEQTLSAPRELHGNLFLRITKDGSVETAPVSFQ